MRIEHGTYTVAHAVASGVEYPPDPLTGEPVASKVYTNDVDNVQVTFTLEDDTIVTLTVYKGTILPLVTKKAIYSGSGTLVILR